MKARQIISILLGILLTLTVSAHRLNEYLQATTIALSKDSVSMHLHLTAGSDVAEKILRNIDLNGDGLISPDEQQAYATMVMGDLHLSIDGRDEPLVIRSWNFSTVKEIRAGAGEIQLIVSAAIPGKTWGHQLVFRNQWQPATSVYLVNCLLPADTSIAVKAQSRSIDQSVYTLDFTTAAQPAIEATDHMATIKTFFLQGVKHILTGYDHLLFICALVLGAISLWDLIKVVTAFTIAHSITLTLATFGLAHLPEYIVEPFIAGSIVLVSVQNIFWPRQARGRIRLCIAFFFGLFHGLGFAGGLAEVMHALPANFMIYALIGFTIGVEAGNQLVLIPLYGLLQTQKRIQNNNIKPRHRLTPQKAISGLVALAGLYYLATDLFL